MKKSFLISLSVAVFSVVSLSSCLKDKGYTDLINGVGAEPIVSFYGAQGGAFLKNTLKAGDTKDVTLTVNLGSPEVLSQDIALKIEADQATLNAYNTKNKTTYVLPPAGVYSPAAPTVTIPAGKRDATIVLKLAVPAAGAPAALDMTKQYAVPLLIKDATGARISANHGFVIVSIN